MLFVRDIKSLFRDKQAMIGRFGLSIFLGCLIGTIFYNVGQAPSDISGVSFRKLTNKHKNTKQTNIT